MMGYYTEEERFTNPDGTPWCGPLDAKGVGEYIKKVRKMERARMESTSTKGDFPKNVLILVLHPSGMPEIVCRGINGVATRAIGDYWEVRFRPLGDDVPIYAAFHKNSLEVLGE